MMCDNCRHWSVCKFTEILAKAASVAEECNNTPDPIRLNPGCEAFDERETTIRCNDEKKIW